MANQQGRNLGTKKTVLITGSSSGFGAYLAQAFAHAGYAVVLHGRDEKRLEAVEDEIFKKENVHCAMVVADLQNQDGIEKIKTALHTQNVEILINNAAINPELIRAAVANNFEDVQSIISTNTSSVIALCYAAFEHFKKNSGTIVNINSVAGLRGSAHEPAYAASKFGLRGFSESVKDAWLKQRVRMIDVYSGAIATGMSSKRHDIKNLMDPQELATFITNLCTTDSFFVRELNVYKTHV